MEGRGVIMECFVPGGSEKIGNSEDTQSLSCSGLYLGGGFILTHGTVVTDILRHPVALPLLKALQMGRCVRAGGGDCAEEGKGRVKEEREVRVKTEDQHDGSDILITAVNAIGARFQAILPTSIDSQASGEFSVHTPTSDSLDLKRQQQDGTKPRTSPLLGQEAIAPPVRISQPPVLPQPPLSPSYRTLPARLERLYILPGLREKIEGIMPASEGWKFMEEEQEGEKKRVNPHIQNIILSTFVLLRIVPDDTCGTGVVAGDVEVAEVTKRMIASSCLVHKGATLRIESSPFGSLSPGVFLNSLSQGVVSNTTGPLLLTDARSVMGSEGAPVFTSVRGSWQLCAMVVSPFCWQRGEWIGLTLLGAILPILRALLHSCNQSEGPSILQDKPMGSMIVTQGASSPHAMGSIGKCEQHEEHLVKDVERAVVGVRVGGGWGSGVVVAADPPLVITCAHVTLPSISGKVTLVLYDGRRVEGRVLHQTRPVTPGSQAKGGAAAAGRSIWDLAVVEASEPLPATLAIASTLPHPGTEVVVAGYGMFSPATLPSTSLSKGIISRVVTAPSSALIWPSFPHPALTQPHSSQIQLSKGQQFSEAFDSTPRLNNPSNYTLQDQSESSTSYRTLKKITSLTQDNEEIRGHELVTHSPEGRDWSTENIHHPHTLGGRVECAGRPTRAQSVAVVMQTTCSVYAGTSGGPVVALHPTQGPQVVGIVACNTRDSTNKATFPHINLAVPTLLLGGIIAVYLETRDLAVLRLLDVECPTASHLWALGNKPQAKL